ncbi:hypothetical protein [Halomonas cupida]|uniref:hypothetical protein n=1 Tax=Halomonas cupida TaxID=44933 RepID=UPI003A95D031
MVISIVVGVAGRRATHLAEFRATFLLFILGLGSERKAPSSPLVCQLYDDASERAFKYSLSTRPHVVVCDNHVVVRDDDVAGSHTDDRFGTITLPKAT